jgi:protease-4
MPEFTPPPPPDPPSSQPRPGPQSGPQSGAPYYAAPRVPYAAGYPPLAAYPRPPQSGWFWAAIVVAILGVVILGMAFTFSSMVKTIAGSDDGSMGHSLNAIAVIDVSGVILDADKIDKQLERYGNDSSVKAIILHIDSPGGGAAASQEIYHEVLRVRQQKHKKIVASVESVGASGAYYIASACDRIYANPASVVGSIGVIMEWTNYGDLLRWAKLKHVAITHGDLKDAGDPTRDLTPKDQAYFQSLVDNMYGQFVHDVAFGRHTTADKIAPLATGQVWTGEQAQPLGLIDEQGGYRLALMETARSVGIAGRPHILQPAKEKRGLLGLLNGTTDDLFPDPSKLLDRAPGFYFLWK